MKNKLCVLIMVLFITILIIPSVGVIGQFGIKSSQTNYDLSPGIVDQNQSITTEIDWLTAGIANYQEFVNQGKNLEEIQLHIGCYFGGSPPLKISIEKPLGTKLSFTNIDAASYALNIQYWLTVNLPDIELERGEKYFIVVECDPGSEYAWSGAFGDPYPQGGSSKAPNWDYAFRTIVDKSKSFGIYNPWKINLLERFPILEFLL